MPLNISMPDPHADLKPRITVIGVGGAGGNAVNNMIRSNLSGVEFMVANTDSQALRLSQADSKVQLGLHLTHGLGAGSRPDIGRAAAEEAIDEIMEQISTSHMVFITAGMGGGTGTGAAPVIARHARDAGILTVGVVTKPFHFEGTHRMRMADEGIEELGKFVDTLIIIPNQNLFRIANERTTFADAFHLADNVLYSGVRGVTDLMVMPGLINLDFADIRTVMSEMGKAMMGTGEASGDGRATQAAEAAISNPLLDDMSMKGAKGILINITGGLDMTLFEVDEAANRIRDEVDPQANIIFGATFDETLDGVMRVSVVATGIDAVQDRLEDPDRVHAFGRPNVRLVQSEPAPDAARPAARPVRETAAAPAAAIAAEGVRAEPAEVPGPLGATVAQTAQAPAAAARHDGEAYAVGGAATAAAAMPSSMYVAAPDSHNPAPLVASAPPRTAAAWPLDSDMLKLRTAQARSDAFIAPAPATPGDLAGPGRPRALSQPAALPEAEGERGMRRTGGWLMDRVRSAVRSRSDEPVADRREEPAGVAPRHEPQATDQGQPALRGVRPEDRPAVASEQDQVLDIPAFLRRQAN